MKTPGNHSNIKKMLVAICQVVLVFLYIGILFFTFYPKPYIPIIIDYWPAWLSNADRTDLLNTPEIVNVINIAFALPNGKGDILWKDEIDVTKTKNAIHFLQKKKKSVLVSIGGSTAENWNLKEVNLDQLANNIKKFVDLYNLNGVDIDYELVEDRDFLALLIKKLRILMPKTEYLITYTAGGIGAYGIPNHENNEWNNYPLKGTDIKILSEIQDLVDWANVMAYNVFDPNVSPPYDPRLALLAFKDLMHGRADKVVLGINVGKQDWPEGTISTSREIKCWLDFVKYQRFKGVMFWNLQMDTEQETGEPTGTIQNLIKDQLMH